MAEPGITPEYTVWLLSQAGDRLKKISGLTSLDVALDTNGYGVATVEFTGGYFSPLLLREDNRLEIWRSVNGRPKRLLGETHFMIEHIQRQRGGEKINFTLSGYGAAYIFEWPAVAYDAGEAQSDKTNYADDMIKEIAAENVGGSATDTDRDMSAYLTIEADSSQGASLSKQFARRQLSKIFTELCDASAAEGKPLFWDVVAGAAGILQLRTYYTCRGVNRGLTSGYPLFFSEARGNLKNVVIDDDYRGAVNYGYGLGSGVKSARNVQTYSDAARVAASIWGRIKEGCRQINYSDTSNAAVTAAAQGLVREKRPKRTMQGEIVNTPGCQYGVHWEHGDMVVAEVDRERYNAIVSPVRIKWNGKSEDITAKLRIEE